MGPLEHGLTRRRTLAGLAALAGLPARAATLSLADIARAKGLQFGTAIASRQLRDDAAYAAAVARDCMVVVAEAEMKWHVIEPERGTRRLGGADAIAAFAARQGLALRGHALVWPLAGRLPKWIEAWPPADKGGLEQALLAHIADLAGRYKGRIASWDVVNEALEARDQRSDGLRRSVLLDAFGEPYFDIVFRAAAAADPGARLVYNDYGLEHEIPWQIAKRAQLLALLERLRARGVPVQAVGIQAHLKAGDAFDARAFAAFLARIAALGLAIEITELDVDDRALAADAAVRDRAIADLVRRFLDVCLAERATRVLLTWGLADHHSWMNRPGWSRSRADGKPQRPLPLDRNLQGKPMWTAIAGAINAAPQR